MLLIVALRARLRKSFLVVPAAATGESLTDAIINALKERLRRQRGRVRGRRLRDEIRAIRPRCAALPLLDDRSADEILGYDEHGVPR
jgi:antitoxin VapB